MSSGKKWILIVVCSLVVVLGLFIGFLPTFLSSKAGMQLIINFVEREGGTSLSIDELQLSWISGQKVKNLQYRDGKGTAASFVSLSSTCSFWNLLWRSGSVGQTNLDSLAISVPKKGTKKKQKKTKAKPKKKKKSFWSDFSGHLIATNGWVTYGNASLQDLFVDVDMGKTTTFNLRGKSSENGQGGTFSLQGKKGAVLEGKGTVTNFPIKTFDLFFGSDLVTYLGERLNGEIETAQSGKEMILSLETPLLQVPRMGFSYDKRFELKGPASFTYLVTPALYKDLKAPFPLKGTLTALSKTIVQGEVSGKNIELENLRLPSFSAAFSGATLKKIQVQGEGLLDFAVESFGASLFGSRVGAQGSATVRVSDGVKISPLNLTLQGNKGQTKIKGSLVKRGIDTKIDLEVEGKLPELFGNRLDLNYHKIEERIDIALDSPKFSLDGAFIAGHTLDLRSNKAPLKIQWSLTEKGYDAFRKWTNPRADPASNNPLFQIVGEGKLKINVSPLSLPLKGEGGLFPKVAFKLFDSYFDAKIEIDDLKLRQGRTGAITELKGFELDVEKKRRGNEPLSFSFDGDVSPKGEVKGKGTIKDFLSEKGKLDFSNVTTSITASIENLPSIFIDALSKLDSTSEFPPSAFLGDVFNATFDAEVEKSHGEITMDIDATGCRATFSGKVKNGILSLKKPLKGVFIVTPELNRILEKSSKLVVAAMEKPITLFIHDEGFRVPLKDLHIRNMSFKDGQLDLGEILCQNRGSTAEVGGLFKLDSRGNISVWFAPATFSMTQGRLHLNRTEILYNRAYQCCLWGKVSFPKRYVDMTLGFTAQSLRSALGIQGISDDYILKVPVEGPFGNVKIDTAAGAAKIAFLIGRKHIAPQLGTWGQILGAIGDLADDQSDVPPPNPPFPWQQSQ